MSSEKFTCPPVDSVSSSDEEIPTLFIAGWFMAVENRVSFDDTFHMWRALRADWAEEKRRFASGWPAHPKDTKCHCRF